MSREAQQDAFGQKVAAWVANSRVVHPVIAEAEQDGRLSQGTLVGLASAAGIPLAGATSPVVLILPHPPIRNVKYRVPEPPPRLARDGPGKVEFEGGEHTAIGDSALLYFSAADPGTPASRVQLVLPNGLSLSYGQIVALGGDFYGIPDQPISDGATLADRVRRFSNAWDTLATARGALSEAPQILEVMQQEIDAVNKALSEGQPASAAYKALGDTLSAQWNKITGGGSRLSPWYPFGRYMQLSAVNWDHFGEHAVAAYQAGHNAALMQAVAARDLPLSQQRRALGWAYAMNAFADHFLSDLFSGGHIRTPRKELYDSVTPGEVGALVTRIMHDEDSACGLAVTNAAKQAWRAYGDKRYFDTVDLANKAVVDAAVQDSVDEVFNAFNTGFVPQPENYLPLARIANLTAARDYSAAQAAGNLSPLFAWNGSATVRRNDVNDLNDYSWTTDWWGWSTWAALLMDYHPNTPTGYPQPPAGSPAVSPGGWQSNRSVPPRLGRGRAGALCGERRQRSL